MVESKVIVRIGKLDCGGPWVGRIERAAQEIAVETNSADGTFRLEFIPDPARVKWPWPDVRRVLVSKVWDGARGISICMGTYNVRLGSVAKDELGTWPPNESRIAENDNGFVKLSEVANGE